MQAETEETETREMAASILAQPRDMTSHRVLVLNGKGMAERGQTEESQTFFQSTAVYSDYVSFIKGAAESVGVSVDIQQTDCLEDAVARLQGAVASGYNAIVFNPAAFTTDKTMGSAVEQVAKDIPVFEMHYSNIIKRGVMSTTGQVCTGVFYGMKLEGYRLALMAAAHAACTEEWARFDFDPAVADSSAKKAKR